MIEDFSILTLELGKYKLNEVFEGLNKSSTLRKLYGKDVDGILDSVKIEINSHPWIIWVNLGEININIDYLKKVDLKTLYLDIVHELVHIKQYREGKNLFDERFTYVTNPTEIEAYKLTAEEAAKIGLSKKEIIDYLKVDWITDEDHEKLVRKVLNNDFHSIFNYSSE
jgi:hypothetical protein